LHDFNLRIPFFVLPGNDVPAGRVVSAGCSNIDVAPTLLEWVGVAGHGEVPGVSLLALLHGAAPGAPRALYARNSTNQRVEEALLVGTHKLVRYEVLNGQAVDKSCCFDLAADPREARNLGCSSEELAQLLETASAAGKRYPAVFVAPDEATRGQLEDLGYGGEAEEH
jgi:arylsulfatase A-like enzyme